MSVDICTRCGEDHLGACQICAGRGCNNAVEEINIESWELTGKIFCADCIEEDFANRAAWLEGE
jgi:hypothetical protein